MKTQKINFILDEKGAITEEMTELSIEYASEYEEEPKPKMLHFDKPFFVFLKK